MQPEHAQNSAQLQSRVKNSFGNTVETGLSCVGHEQA